MAKTKTIQLIERVQSNSDSYEQLLNEIKKEYPYFIDIYYSEEGVWCVVSQNIELDGREFDTFFELLSCFRKTKIIASHIFPDIQQYDPTPNP